MEQLLVHSGSWVNVALMTIVRGAGILFVSSHFHLGPQNRHFADRNPGEEAPACPFPLTFLFWQEWLTLLRRLTEEKFLLILTASLKAAYPKSCTFSFSALTFLLANIPGLRASPRALFLSPTCTLELPGSFQVCTSTWSNLKIPRWSMLLRHQGF